MSRFASFKCHFKMKWLVLFFTTLVADALKIENVIFEGCRTFQPQTFLAPGFNPRLFIPRFFNHELFNCDFFSTPKVHGGNVCGGKVWYGSLDPDFPQIQNQGSTPDFSSPYFLTVIFTTLEFMVETLMGKEFVA